MLKPELILIRGLPGSGKSTMAEGIFKVMENMCHFEADMYFIKDGEYVFDASKLKEAHEWCLASTKAALAEGKSVIVSNTFVKLWEIGKYKALVAPEQFNVLECKQHYKSIHNVPLETIQRMRDTWEQYPSFT